MKRDNSFMHPLALQRVHIFVQESYGKRPYTFWRVQPPASVFLHFFQVHSICVYVCVRVFAVSYTHLDVYKRQFLYRQPPHVDIM